MNHYIGQIIPIQGKTPVFAQVYVHDEDEQLRLRLDNAMDLNPATLEFWNRVMTGNPFATRFRQIGMENCPERRYVIKERIGDDIRRYFD